MSRGEPTRWITVNGSRVPIFEGQSKAEAVKNALSNRSASTKGSASKSGTTVKDAEKRLAENRARLDKTKDPAEKRRLILENHKIMQGLDRAYGEAEKKLLGKTEKKSASKVKDAREKTANDFKKGDTAYYRDYQGTVYEGKVDSTLTTKGGTVKVTVVDKHGQKHYTTAKDQQEYVKKFGTTSNKQGLKFKQDGEKARTEKGGSATEKRGTKVSTPFGVFHKKGNRWVNDKGQSWSNDQMDKWLDR